MSKKPVIPASPLQCCKKEQLLPCAERTTSGILPRRVDPGLWCFGLIFEDVTLYCIIDGKSREKRIRMDILRERNPDGK